MRAAQLVRAGSLFAARDGTAHAALLAMSAAFATLPMFVSIALASRWLASPDILHAAERGLFALWPKLIARPVAQAIAAAADDLPTSALPPMALAFLLLAGNALEILRTGLARFYAPAAGGGGPLRRRLRAILLVAAGTALAFALASLVAALTELPPTAPAVEPSEPPPGAGPLLFLGQTLGGLALVAGGLVFAHTRLVRSDLALRAVLPGIGVSVVGWIASVNLVALYQAHVAPPQALYGPFAAAFATLLFFFVGACAVLYGAALNAVLATPSAEAPANR
ncbi:YihY/virulence factor BrkB family protein [Salinarimonas rosea]|uniref:YihY/virulence factor BrkB family protein n=1 Tax=Salinarimonas rosea TaxID=552063 RepID=UPI00040D8690|nr:YhjD/YihY/BrkB family envelope integrity protein [Salinarimonas rosea]